MLTQHAGTTGRWFYLFLVEKLTALLHCSVCETGVSSGEFFITACRSIVPHTCYHIAQSRATACYGTCTCIEDLSHQNLLEWLVVPGEPTLLTRQELYSLGVEFWQYRTVCNYPAIEKGAILTVIGNQFDGTVVSKKFTTGCVR